ncbi:hypothetical protein H4582DRAFT_1813741, partial [Lactarius indigo]
SYFIHHLPSGCYVDVAIKSREDRVVATGPALGTTETLSTACCVTEKVQTFATINLRNITKVPDFNKVQLGITCTELGRLPSNSNDKYIMTDLGAGNNNMFCWTMDNKQESIDIIDHGVSKRRDLTVSPKSMCQLETCSTSCRRWCIRKTIPHLQVLGIRQILEPLNLCLFCEVIP